MKYLLFKITDGMPTIPDIRDGFEVVPLLEDLTPEQIVERLLTPAVPVLLPPLTGPIIEIPREDSEARKVEARKRDPWEDPNPEETQRRKNLLTEDEILKGSRITAVDEEI